MSKDSAIESLQFEGQKIRRVWDNDTERWWFAVTDVVGSLAETKSPSKYWSDMKRRQDSGELSANCRKFRMEGKNGRFYQVECADIEGLLRIIQSIPSPNAEPFKLWLAKVGRERLEAGKDPAQLDREAYRRLGYSNEWIEARIQSQYSSQILKETWQERGVAEEHHPELENSINKGTFGLETTAHKAYKGLEESHDLQDNMTRLELVFDMLGDEAARKIAEEIDAQGLTENKEAAKQGGEVAGDARKMFEDRTGGSVISKENHLNLLENKEKKQLKGKGDGEEK